MDGSDQSGTPASGEPAAGERFLLLADISGYTGFMTGVEHEHGVDFNDGIPAAYGVLAELLNTVIEGVEHDFGIVKLEGDAVGKEGHFVAGLDGVAVSALLSRLDDLLGALPKAAPQAVSQ